MFISSIMFLHKYTSTYDYLINVSKFERVEDFLIVNQDNFDIFIVRKLKYFIIQYK